MSNTKRCSRCKQIKSVIEFRRNHKNPDGLTYPCKTCLNQAYKEYRLRKPRIFTSELAEKQRVRNQVPEVKEKRQAYRSAYYLKNKAQIDKSRKLYLQNNPGLNSAYVRAYRLKKKGNEVFRISTKELILLRSKPCFYCATKISGTVDHVVPIALGGTHSIGNLVPACKSCNSKKQDKLLIYWRKQKGELTMNKREQN